MPYKYANVNERFTEILKANMGNISKTCKACNIDRETYYNWTEKYEDFKKRCEEVQESLIDDSESILHGLIQEGSVPCVLFHLKTKGATRGYIEKKEIDVKTKITKNEDIENLNTEDLQKIEALLEKRQKSAD